MLVLITIIFFLYLYPFLFLHSLSLLSWFRLVSFINNHWKVCLFIQQKFMEHLPRLHVIVMNSEWDGYHSVVLEPGNFSPLLPQNSSTCSSRLIWSTNIIVLSPYWKWFNVLLPRTGVPSPWTTKCSGPWPIKNWSIKQKVSGGSNTKASSVFTASPHHSHYCWFCIMVSCIIISLYITM